MRGGQIAVDYVADEVDESAYRKIEDGVQTRKSVKLPFTGPRIALQAQSVAERNAAELGFDCVEQIIDESVVRIIEHESRELKAEQLVDQSGARGLYSEDFGES